MLLYEIDFMLGMMPPLPPCLPASLPEHFPRIDADFLHPFKLFFSPHLAEVTPTTLARPPAASCR